MKLTMKQVEAHLGETLTAREIKHLFGYSASTYIGDTVLYQRRWLHVVYRQPKRSGPYRHEITRGEPF